MSVETVFLIVVSFAAGIAIAGLLILIARRDSNDQISVELLTTTLRKSLNEVRTELLGITQQERLQEEARFRQVVGPLEASLERFEAQTRTIEKNHEQGLGSLRQYLSEAIRGQAELRYQTHRLVGSLQSSNTRGRWGEISLRRAVELAGMVEHCDFELQPRLAGSRLRPDLIVHLPNRRLIVVDAKVPMKAYLASLEAEEEGDSERLMAEHCRQILRHIEALASKKYWSQLEQSPEFVVLFLPLESLLSSALRVRHQLLEEAISQGVMLVTPVTLVALLRAVEYGWKQTTLNRNVEQVCERARDLHSQVAQLAQHLAEVGRHLDHAVASHNRSATAVERRVLAPVRELSELGVPTNEAIRQPDQVTRRSRSG